MVELAASSPRGSTDERTCLLSPTDQSASFPLSSPDKKPWVRLVVLVFLLVSIIDVGGFLSDAPKTRVFEENICLVYYRQHDPSQIGSDGSVPEKLCKVDEVQQKLAMIFGWQDMFDAVPGIFLAVPYGALADRVGRKWIFTVSLLGLQLSSVWILVICYFKTLPLQLTWISSMFYLVGGGPIVAAAIGITMLSDIVPTERRTPVFLYLGASVLVAEMTAPIIAAKLMEKGNWLPLLLSLAIQQVGICIAVLFPETLHLRDLPEPGDPHDQVIEPHAIKGHGFGLRDQFHHFRNAIHFIKSDWSLAMIILTFMVNRLGSQGITLIVRYASKRYTWEIKDASYLLSFRAAANLVVVCVFLPLVNLCLLRYLRLPTYSTDLWIARGSIVLTTVSFLIMGIAAQPALLVFGLLVYNLGTGFGAAMRSFAIHTVGGQESPDIGKLMSTIAIVESIGVVIAGPLLNQMFQWGMDLGNEWLGLPFLAAMLAFAAITVVTFIIGTGGKQTAYTAVLSEEGE